MTEKAWAKALKRAARRKRKAGKTFGEEGKSVKEGAGGAVEYLFSAQGNVPGL
jgi:hypothetical protein